MLEKEGKAPSFGVVLGSRITGRAVQRLVPRSGHIMLFTLTSPERGGDQIRVYFSRDDAQAAAQQGQSVLRVAIHYVGWPSITLACSPWKDAPRDVSHADHGKDVCGWLDR